MTNSKQLDFGTLKRVFFVACFASCVFCVQTQVFAQVGSSHKEEMEEEMDEDEDEMEMDQSMSGRSGHAGSSAVMAGASGVAWISALSDLDLGPLFEPLSDDSAIVAGPVLNTEAQTSYQSGNYPLALQLYFAHMVTEYQDAQFRLKTVKFSQYLKRPVWNIKWGVSYAVRGDAADPQPIRAGQTPPGRQASGRGRQRGGDDTDEMSMEMEKKMEMEMEMKMEMEESMSSEMESGGQRSSSSHSHSPVAREMLDKSVAEQFDQHLGLVAERIASEFGARYRKGDYGTALVDVTPTEGESSASEAVDDLLAESPEPPSLWIPGVVFVGKGDSKEMIKIARGDSVDFLLHFDISVKTDRNGNVQNVSRCRLIHPGTGKSMATSKAMDSAEAAKLAGAGRGDETEYVSERIEGLFLTIDRQIKTVDLPQLTPEIAKKRIASLMAISKGSQLKTLAETRLYQAQELLTEADVESIFNIVMGEKGLKLIHGTREQKLETARELALRSLAN